jgi:hypothetical protein
LIKEAQYVRRRLGPEDGAFGIGHGPLDDTRINETRLLARKRHVPQSASFPPSAACSRLRCLQSVPIGSAKLLFNPCLHPGVDPEYVWWDQDRRHDSK